MTITNLARKVQQQTNARDNEFLVIHFTSNWCVFCHLTKPLITKIINQYRIETKMIDTEENAFLVEKYGIYKINCTLIFKNEQLLESITG